MLVIMGAGLILFGGLAKMGLDLTDLRTKRNTQSRQQRQVEPLVIDGMQMPSNDGWTYFPPPAR
jgi:hypothetical protein